MMEFPFSFPELTAAPVTIWDAKRLGDITTPHQKLQCTYLRYNARKTILNRVASAGTLSKDSLSKLQTMVDSFGVLSAKAQVPTLDIRPASAALKKIALKN